MAPLPLKGLDPNPAPFGSLGRHADLSLDPQLSVAAFAAAIAGLGPMELRVIHLAMSRAVALEAADRSDEADVLLLRLLRILDDDAPPGAEPEVGDAPPV